MAVVVEVTRIDEFEEQCEGAVGAANNDGTPDVEADVAPALARSIMSDLAQMPAADMTEVAIKIGIAVCRLRVQLSEPLLQQLLESAEQDCLRLARP
jgi:hypothetical protein